VCMRERDRERVFVVSRCVSFGGEAGVSSDNQRCVCVCACEREKVCVVSRCVSFGGNTAMCSDNQRCVCVSGGGRERECVCGIELCLIRQRCWRVLG